MIWTEIVFNLSIPMSVKYGTSITLCSLTVMHLGTEKHKKMAEPMLERFDEVGCFALTELGHGSNVRGIETEAHYDKRTKQFEIRTPREEAMKFWIGGAAKTATLCALWAQLYIDGKCHGVHAFFIRIRDRKTHDVMPGVIIGDCGKKNGIDGVDNGFIYFYNY